VFWNIIHDQFTRNFIRVVLPFASEFEQVTGQVTGQVTEQVTEQVEMCLQFCTTPRSTKEIMQHLGLSHRESFRNTILLPLIRDGKIVLTIPDKPNSSKQKYVTVKSN
jgi:ATP-dependent DNA helicase RecG